MKKFAYNMLVSSFGLNSTTGELIPPNEEIMEFINNNDLYVRQMAKDHADTDDYWLAVAQMYSQLDGLLSGVNDFFEIEMGLK